MSLKTSNDDPLDLSMKQWSKEAATSFSECLTEENTMLKHIKIIWKPDNFQKLDEVWDIFAILYSSDLFCCHQSLNKSWGEKSDNNGQWNDDVDLSEFSLFNLPIINFLLPILFRKPASLYKNTSPKRSIQIDI